METRSNVVLIAGATGLIGQAVVSLLSSNAKVYALVRSIKAASFPDGVTPIVQDLSEEFKPQIPEKIDTVIYLAQSDQYKNFPDCANNVFDLNVTAVQRILDWARRHSVQRVVYASSGGVYGTGPLPFTEDTALASDYQLSHYLATKRCGEIITNSYRAHFTTIILRFFFVYGPLQRKTMLFPRLIENVKTGRAITLHGPEGFRLNPIFVSDAASAVVQASNLQHHAVVNIAGSEIFALRDICEQISQIVGHTPKYEVVPSTEIPDLVGATRQMLALFGPPRIGLQQGLYNVILGGSPSSRRAPEY